MKIVVKTSSDADKALVFEFADEAHGREAEEILKEAFPEATVSIEEPTKVYSSVEEFINSYQDLRLQVARSRVQTRKRGLAKLTAEEKEVLGVKQQERPNHSPRGCSSGEDLPRV